MLQLILDSRNLLEAGSADTEEKSGEAGQQKTRTANSKTEGSGGGQEHKAVFAQRMGVIFSAMYNVFVDAEVLQTIQDVAGRLKASSTTLTEWKSTEIGRLVHCTDDLSQERVRDILDMYSCQELQHLVSTESVRRQRSAMFAKYFSPGDVLVSGAMGLASLHQHLTLKAYNNMAHECKLVPGIRTVYCCTVVQHPASMSGIDEFTLDAHI